MATLLLPLGNCGGAATADAEARRGRGRAGGIVSVRRARRRAGEGSGHDGATPAETHAIEQFLRIGDFPFPGIAFDAENHAIWIARPAPASVVRVDLDDPGAEAVTATILSHVSIHETSCYRGS